MHWNNKNKREITEANNGNDEDLLILYTHTLTLSKIRNATSTMYVSEIKTIENVHCSSA